MRFEINTFARIGDILNESEQLVQRVVIGRGLSESDTAEEWLASITDGLAKAGYRAESLPEVRLPLTAETAIDRYVMSLEPLA